MKHHTAQKVQSQKEHTVGLTRAVAAGSGLVSAYKGKDAVQADQEKLQASEHLSVGSQEYGFAAYNIRMKKIKIRAEGVFRSEGIGSIRPAVQQLGKNQTDISGKSVFRQTLHDDRDRAGQLFFRCGKGNGIGQIVSVEASVSPASHHHKVGDREGRVRGVKGNVMGDDSLPGKKGENRRENEDQNRTQMLFQTSLFVTDAPEQRDCDIGDKRGRPHLESCDAEDA